MRVAILGGGGFRTPLLTGALGAADFGIREVALHDADAERLAVVAPIARLTAPGLRVIAEPDPASAVRGARFVISTIRVGGQEARARDEGLCIAGGVLGQETVGAAGAALAMRNIPAALEHARIVEREAPDALLLNYTNPAGVVTEAIRAHTSVAAVGICDTPAQLAGRAAHLAGVDLRAASVGWSGVNHCGWLTGLFAPAGRSAGNGARGAAEHRSRPPGADSELQLPGEDRLAGLLRDPDRLRRVHRFPLFDLAEMGQAIPSEYVFFHAHPERAVARVRGARTTRGRAILGIERRLFAHLQRPGTTPGEALAAYREGVAERDDSYFRLEGRDAAAPAEPGFEPASGYDRIALEVMAAVLRRTPSEIVLNLPNRTRAGTPALMELPVGEVVEAPARVSREGMFPVPQRPLPAAAATLLRRVRNSEREIGRGAAAGDVEATAAALRDHPAGGAAAAAIFPTLTVPRDRAAAPA